MNGLWNRQKKPEKVDWKALLRYEEISTLLVEVESFLNIHLLPYVYNENDKPQTPTPLVNFLKLR